MYALRVTNHGVQAGLLLIVIHDGSVEPGPLRRPHLVLEAAVAPRDQHERPPARTAAGGFDGRTRLGRIRSAQRAADPIAAHAGPEARRGVKKGEGEGGGVEADEGGAGAEGGGEEQEDHAGVHRRGMGCE